jgi:hypothetical protein
LHDQSTNVAGCLYLSFHENLYAIAEYGRDIGSVINTHTVAILQDPTANDRTQLIID